MSLHSEAAFGSARNEYGPAAQGLLGSNPSVSAIDSRERGFLMARRGWPTPRCCCIPHETFRKRHSARDSAQGCLRQRASLPSAARTMHTALQSRIKVRARTVHNVSCPYRAQCIETCTPPVRTRRNFRTRHPPEQPRLMPPARGPRFRLPPRRTGRGAAVDRSPGLRRYLPSRARR